MSYEFLPDIAMADIAFRAWGESLPEVFVSASDAVMNAMIENPDAIRPRELRNIDLKNDQLDMLLFNFLQEVIYYKDSELILLRMRNVRITDEDRQFHLHAEGVGERLDPNRHEQRVDVKAVTLHKFELQQTPNGWQATVILDI